MPFVFVAIGLILFLVAIRGTQDEAIALLQSEFTGERNFLTWIVAFGMIAAFGYIPRLEPISRGFMILVIMVLFLSNDGFFNRFREAIINRPAQN